MNLLIETSFLSEFTQHSNPELQANIKKEDLHWKFNSTMSAMQGGLRKNYVIKEYEKLAKEELIQVEHTVRKSEGQEIYTKGSNVLKAGQFVNSLTMISPFTYLSDY